MFFLLSFVPIGKVGAENTINKIVNWTFRIVIFRKFFSKYTNFIE